MPSPQDGDGDGSFACDIGAVEVALSVPALSRWALALLVVSVGLAAVFPLRPRPTTT